MKVPVASALATAMRRRIARRLTIARWSKIAAVPTLAAIFYLGRHNAWVIYVGLALFLGEVIAVLVGEAQRCPLCDASLVIRRYHGEEFATECPECGYLID